MHPEIAASAVESEMMARPSGPIGACYRFRLAQALRAGGDPISGVERQLCADLVDLPLARTWPTPLQPPDAAKDEPFAPNVKFSDGSHTLVPEALDAERETPLRDLAQSSANPFLRGAFFDILWVRYPNHVDARQAVEERVASADLLDIKEAWFEATMELARAGMLALQLNDRKRLRDTVAPALEVLGTRALETSEPAIFVGVASDLCHALLINPKATAVIGNHGERWGRTALWIGHELRRRGMFDLADDALRVAASLLSGANCPDDARQTETQRIEWLLQRAEAKGGTMRAHLVQMAIDNAAEAGLSELASRAKTKLRDAVEAATADMRSMSMDIRLPGLS